jgi:hypothetical protein
MKEEPSSARAKQHRENLTWAKLVPSKPTQAKGRNKAHNKS